MTSEASATLHYGNRRHLLRRSSTRWLVAAIILAAVVAIVYWLYGDTVRERMTLVLAQRGVARGDVIAPDRVVFEEDPQPAASLLSSLDYLKVSGALLGMPPALHNYRAARNAPTNATNATLFVGQRSDDNGKPAIIYAYAGIGLVPSPETEFYIGFECDPLASVMPWKAAPVPIAGAVTLGSRPLDGGIFPIVAHRWLTLYAGTPDPIDPQRFTSRYAIDGETGTIEFIFHSVGNVKVRVLDGPLLPDKLEEWAKRIKEYGRNRMSPSIAERQSR